MDFGCGRPLVAENAGRRRLFESVERRWEMGVALWEGGGLVAAVVAVYLGADGESVAGRGWKEGVSNGGADEGRGLDFGVWDLGYL